MKDDKYWENASARVMLMSERSELSYEKELESLYASLSKELEKEIRFVFSKYGTDNKLLYSKIRSTLKEDDLSSFKKIITSVIEDEDESVIMGVLKDEAKKLNRKKYFSVLEYLQFMILYHIVKMEMQNSELIYSLQYDNFIAAHIVHFYSFIVGVEKNIPFVPVESRDVESVIKSTWNGRDYKNSIKDTIGVTKLKLETLIPQMIAQGYTTERFTNRIKTVLNTQNGYDRGKARATVNFVNNQAHKKSVEELITKYIYCAVLDNKTSMMCRDMDGSVFRFSEAVVWVNYPPLHNNCRSSVEPYIDSEVTKKLSEYPDLGRRVVFSKWIKENMPKEQQNILSFIDKYYE